MSDPDAAFPGEEREPSLCPYCGELFEADLDPGEEEGELVQDCAVCCRPVSLRFRFEDGNLVELELLREDDA